MGPTDNSVPEEGSIAAIVTRLARWGRLAPQGLARVEFVSEFSRQRAVSDLRTLYTDKGIPFYEIELPLETPAELIVTDLKRKFQSLEPGVVSLSGFETAFPLDIPLFDSLRLLNFNRENLADHPLRQIWWMTPPFAQKVVQSIPDLNSWFIVKLMLTEAIVRAEDEVQNSVSSEQIEKAQSSWQYLSERFLNGLKQGASGEELLRIILPAYLDLCKIEPPQSVKYRLDKTLEALKNIGFDVDNYFQSEELFSTATGDSNASELAEIYNYIDQKDKSEELLHRGLMYDPDAYESNFFALKLAEMYISQGRYNEASHLLDRIVHFEKQSDISWWLKSSHLSKFAQLYSSCKMYVESNYLFEEILQLAVDCNEDWRVADVLTYARFLRILGREKQARWLEETCKVKYSSNE